MIALYKQSTMITIEVSIDCSILMMATDDNECHTIDNGGCDHYCHNIVGGYYCSCLSGYNLSNADNKSCEGEYL